MRREDNIMRKFLIKVNGNQYEVEVEEVLSNIGASAASVPVQETAAPAALAAPAPAPAPVQAAPAPSAPAPQAAPGGTVGSVKVTAPMPGTILKVAVSVGEKVKKGQVLVVLEAMKMENEIVAATDGVVASVNVTKGASVNTGDLLVSLN